MQDADMILSLLRDRFDALERRLDQQRGAIEQGADAYNRLAGHVYKQNGRLDKVEEWIKNRRRKGERREDAYHQRRGRLATLLSGLIGAGAMWGLSALTGMH